MNTERARFITHGGREIVLFDFAGMTNPAEILSGIEEARRFIGRLPPDGSALTLTDVRGAHYNAEIMGVLKRFAADNKPYVRAAAVLATVATHRVAVTAAALFSRRTLKAFEDPEAAKDWLIRY